MKDEERTWQNRAHFFHVAAEAMRRILIEHARRNAALKHGGKQERLNVALCALFGALPDEKALLVDAALEELEKLPRGMLRVTMRPNDIEEAERWVMAFGTHATVVRPRALAERVAAIGRELEGSKRQQAASREDDSSASAVPQLRRQRSRPNPARGSSL